jgi:hypothetical protein
MKFRDEAIARKWFASKDHPVATHLMMDGGRLAVPDDQAGAFLNIYFASVVIRKEKLSIVEVKTPVFRLFFDLDIRFKNGAHGIQRTISKLCKIIWEHVTTDFFVLDANDMALERPGSTCSLATAGTVASEGSGSGDITRMIVCQAPSKVETSGRGDDAVESVKHGVHVVFPGIFVNSPIALACREALLEKLPEAFLDECHDPCTDSSTESTASTSGFANPTNSWDSIVDDSVFRGSGLRLIFSGKGRGEDRAYVPRFEIDRYGDIRTCQLDTAAVKREYIHDTSLRVFHERLTLCAAGEHEIADQPGVHSMGGCVIGTGTSINMYQEAIPKLRELLPAVYKDTRFLKAFVTSHAVMIKTASRYCMNKKGEHRTSTVYLCVTKRGVCQKCYCRKEERGCANYSSPLIPLPCEVIRVFFPDDVFLDDPVEVSKKKASSMSTKKRKNSLQSILGRSRAIKSRHAVK